VKTHKQPILSLADIINGEMSRLSSGRYDTAIALQNAWAELVGNLLANKSRVLYVKEHCLFIEAQSATWRQEINLQKDEILKRVNTKYPALKLQSLKIKAS
jgi:hypothetical protein